MVDQGRSDYYVLFTMNLYALTLLRRGSLGGGRGGREGVKGRGKGEREKEIQIQAFLQRFLLLFHFAGRSKFSRPTWTPTSDIKVLAWCLGTSAKESITHLD